MALEEIEEMKEMKGMKETNNILLTISDIRNADVKSRETMIISPKLLPRVSTSAVVCGMIVTRFPAVQSTNRDAVRRSLALLA